MAGPLPIGPLEREPQPVVGLAPAAAVPARRIGRVRELLYFAVRDRKIFISLAILATMLVIAFVGPALRDYGPQDYVGPSAQPPSSEYWFGTTAFGQDVFVQFVHGVGATFFVGFVGGGLAALVGMTVGFVAGYRGGLVDEVLNMLTNVVLVLPTLIVLIIVVAYVDARGLLVEAVFIGLTSWPWAARAIRAQTLSLRSREFVDLARLSGQSTRQIIVGRDRPEHELLPDAHVHPALRWCRAHRGHPGLHRPGPHRRHVAGADDEQRRALVGPPAGHVVVVHPAGRGHRPHRRLALHPQRGPRRGLQPPPAEAVAMTLTVSDLRVYYTTLAGDVHALDGVTFEVADGEIMGLAGESGCGKSTLGNSLIRLDGRMRHVGGTVELDGVELPIGDSRAMDRHRFHDVSIIPQYAMSALNPTRKIGRMASEVIGSRGISFSSLDEEFERRLALVGLAEHVLDRYPMELSGGMKQRVVMVLSTLLDPSLLIADEITSALDVSTQKAVAGALVGLRDNGFVKSMIVITHDLAILHEMADTILVMYAGPPRREGAHQRHHRGAPPPLHEAAHLVPAGGGRAHRGAAAGGHPRAAAVAAGPAAGLPLPGALPAGR